MTAHTVNSCAIDRSGNLSGVWIAALGGTLDADGGGAAANIAGRVSSRLGWTAGAVTKGTVGSAFSVGVGVEADSITGLISPAAH